MYLLFYLLRRRSTTALPTHQRLASGYSFACPWYFTLGGTCVSLVLPVAQIAATWLLARLHQRIESRMPLIIGVILNLLSLATFKYLDFGLASIEAISGFTLPRAHIILPIGISFFSFQLISYLVDRMRGHAPIYPFRPFALFVLLYPHLIAGPIVRHNELIPQFTADPRRDGLWKRIGIGLVIFTIGFAKKVLLADKLAKIADPLFSQAATRVLDLGEAWTAVLAFSFQLFLDFSAYTEMAIGSALIFGLILPENFSSAISLHQHSGLLATLAHFTIELSARLSLHPTGRKSEWAGALCLRHDGHDGPLRFVAWGGMDLRSLGFMARAWPRRVPWVAAA